jgi:hypothetical protein
VSEKRPDAPTTPAPSSSDAARATSEASDTAGDRALVVGASEDGSSLAILRKRSADAPLEAGIVRPLQEGAPIHGEVIRLAPRPDAPLVCDVEVQLDARKGPPKVASSRYREGWDRVFATPARPTSTLN